MNWSGLTDRVLLSFHEDQTELRLKAKKYLIEAQEDFVLKTKCLERSKWFYLVANTEYLTLPDDFIGIKRVEFNGQALEFFDALNYYDSLYDSSETYEFGIPERYFLHGNDRLYLLPGVKSADWLAMWYSSRPKVLDDDATKYRKLPYDTLTAHFIRGETVTKAARTLSLNEINIKDGGTGEDWIEGSSGTIDWISLGMEVGSKFTVSNTGYNDGTYTVTTVTETNLYVATGTFTEELDISDSTIVRDTATGVVEYDDNDKKTGTLTLSSVYGYFEDNVTLTGSSNGSATTNGNDSAFATAGDDPDIDEDYRKYLVDYAKGMIYEDMGKENRADRLLARYYTHREQIEAHFRDRQIPDLDQIIDVLDSTVQSGVYPI